MFSNKNKKGLAFNTMVLASGNIVAQVITVSLIPVITRLFDPSEYGSFAIFISITSIIINISSLRYNAAIMLPSEESDADSLTLLSMILVTIISLISGIAVFIWNEELYTLVKVKNFQYIIFLFPVSILIEGMYHCLSPWSLRARKFKLLATSRISMAAGNRGTTLLLGHYTSLGTLGLILGTICGQTISFMNILLVRGARKFLSVFSKDNIKRLPGIMKRYKDFPKYSWSILIEVFDREMLVLLLSIFFQPVIIGYYALGKRALGQPMLFLGEAISRSFYQKSSELYREGILLPDMSSRLLKYLLVLILLPLILLAIISEDVVAFVFSETWRPAGNYIQVLTPMFITTFLFRPISVFFDTMEKQKERLVFNITRASINTAVISLFGMLGNPILAVGMFSASNTIINLYGIYWLMGKAGVKRSQISGMLISKLFPSILFAFPVLAVKHLLNADLAAILFSSFSSIAFYILYLVFTDSYIRKKTKHFLLRR